MGLCAFAPLSTGCDALLSATFAQIAAVLAVSILQVFVTTVSVTLSVCLRLHSFIITDSLLLISASFFTLSSILESLALFISSGTASTLIKLHLSAAAIALVSLLCLFLHISLLLHNSYLRNNTLSSHISRFRLFFYFALLPLFIAILACSIITFAKLRYVSYTDILSIAHVNNISNNPPLVPPMTSIVTGLCLAFISVAALFVLIHPIPTKSNDITKINRPLSSTASSASATLFALSTSSSSSSTRPEYFGIQIYWVFLAFVLQSVAFVLYFAKQSFAVLLVQRVLSFLAFSSFILEQHARLSKPHQSKNILRNFDENAISHTPTIIKHKYEYSTTATATPTKERPVRPHRLNHHPISILSPSSNTTTRKTSSSSRRLTNPHLSLQLSPLFLDLSRWNRRHDSTNRTPISGYTLDKTSSSPNDVDSFYADEDKIDSPLAISCSSAPPGIVRDPTLPPSLRTNDRRNETPPHGYQQHPRPDAKLVHRPMSFKRRNTDDINVEADSVDGFSDVAEDEDGQVEGVVISSYSSTTLGDNIIGQPPRQRRNYNKRIFPIFSSSSPSISEEVHRAQQPSMNASTASLAKSNSFRDLQPATSLSALQRMVAKLRDSSNSNSKNDLNKTDDDLLTAQTGINTSTGNISAFTTTTAAATTGHSAGAGAGLSSFSLATHHNISTEWTIQDLDHHQVQIDNNPNSRIMSIHGLVGSHWRNSRSSSTFGHYSVDENGVPIIVPGGGGRLSVPPPLPDIKRSSAWNISDPNLPSESEPQKRSSTLWPPGRHDSKGAQHRVRSISTPLTSIHPSSIVSSSPGVSTLPDKNQSTPSLQMFKHRKSSLSSSSRLLSHNNIAQATSTTSLASSKCEAASISSSNSSPKSIKTAPLNIVKK